VRRSDTVEHILNYYHDFYLDEYLLNNIIANTDRSVRPLDLLRLGVPKSDSQQGYGNDHLDYIRGEQFLD
jgi:hypothetical protein